jgi:acetoin utilization deacetylase AcuC-like enzyme
MRYYDLVLDASAGRRVARRGWLGRFLMPATAVGLAGCAPAGGPTLLASEKGRTPVGASLISSARDSVFDAEPHLAPAPVAPEPEVVAPPVPKNVPVFYRPEYTLAGYSYDTTRKARWVADALADAPVPGLELVEPELLSEAELTAVHDGGYINAVRSGQPRGLAQSQGWPWDPGLFPMVLASNGGAVAAAEAALELGVAGSLSSGLHHARRARGSGNCTFNGLALAARRLLDAGARRILVLDLDAHCGGGTDELLGADRRVAIVDVSVYPFDVYRPQQRNTLDVVQRAHDYLPTIRRRLDALDGSAFDICLYNAGMDPHEGCPLGGLGGITTAVLAEREQVVFDWCRQHNLPVSFVLAGGYTGPSLDTAGVTELHRLTLTAASQMPLRTT